MVRLSKTRATVFSTSIHSSKFRFTLTFISGWHGLPAFFSRRGERPACHVGNGVLPADRPGLEGSLREFHSQGHYRPPVTRESEAEPRANPERVPHGRAGRWLSSRALAFSMPFCRRSGRLKAGLRALCSVRLTCQFDRSFILPFLLKPPTPANTGTIRRPRLGTCIAKSIWT
jgi:hypothetical protein